MLLCILFQGLKHCPCYTELKFCREFKFFKWENFSKGWSGEIHSSIAAVLVHTSRQSASPASQIGFGATSWLQGAIKFIDKLGRFSAAKSPQVETQTTGKKQQKVAYRHFPLSQRIRSIEILHPESFTMFLYLPCFFPTWALYKKSCKDILYDVIKRYWS